MKKTLSYMVPFVTFLGCIEPIEIESDIEGLESLLVVEATLTTELKKQLVSVSRSSSFAKDTPRTETGAEVVIRSDAGDTYVFAEEIPGRYVSQEAFRAEENRQYRLYITTIAGTLYESEGVSLNGSSPIDRIYAERTVNSTGQEGVAIFVDTRANTTDARFYRYEYEETYKIIAPNWAPFGFNVFINDFGERDFTVALRTEEQRVCYNTERSNTIIQADTEDLIASEVSRFLVRFIDSNDFRISHRYSILVRQLLQTPEAADFYSQLERFSTSESVFYDVQPGFINGNISATNDDLPVLGFFDVVSVSEERLFFNYEAFFPGEPLPPYPFECRIYVPGNSGVADILDNRVAYVGENENPDNGFFPYFVTFRPCGDCTALGSNVVPEFWIE